MRIIDIHTHGGFGVNFNRADVEEIYKFAKKIKEHSYDAFCPTLASDTQENNRHIPLFSALYCSITE